MTKQMNQLFIAFIIEVVLLFLPILIDAHVYFPIEDGLLVVDSIKVLIVQFFRNSQPHCPSEQEEEREN